MAEFIQISLDDMMEQLGEDKVKNILSTFMCPQNKDVEYFLKNKAIVFAQRKISKTYLVYWRTEDKKSLLTFYERNNFIVFGKRKLDKDETNIDGEYLMQLFITT